MTYVTDPIGDLLARIRNAQHAKHTECSAPWSRLKEQLCEVLKKEGWITDAEVVGEKPRQELVVHFSADKPKLVLERISKPGRRVYMKASELKPILNGFGIAVLTTSQGLMTDKEAREKQIGGEVLCTIS